MLSRILSVPAAAFDATAWSLKTTAHLLERAAGVLHPADGSTTSTGGHLTPAPTAEPEPTTAAEAASPPGAGATRAAGGDASATVSLDEVADAAPGWAELSDGAESAAGDDAPARAPEPTAPPRPRTSTFKPERLAAAPVKTVIRALEGLSSSELSALYEHEAANRNRKTLLRAIEQAVLPPDPVVDRRTPMAAAEDEALTDVGDVAVEAPSETVYSSETS